MIRREARAGGPALASICELEVEAQRELHDARRPSGRYLPKTSIQLLTRVQVKERASIHGLELGVIERVVEIPAELEVRGLAFYRDHFDDCQVPVVEARSADGILGGIPDAE